MAVALKRAQQQVVLNGHAAKQLAFFRHQIHAAHHHALHFRHAFHTAVKRYLPARGQQAHDGRQRGGLAGTVGANHGDNLPFAHIQAHLADRLHLAVGHRQLADLQNIGHVTPLPDRLRARRGLAVPLLAGLRQFFRQTPSPPPGQPGSSQSPCRAPQSAPPCLRRAGA